MNKPFTNDWNSYQKYQNNGILFLQTQVYCLVRELPNIKADERIIKTLRQYGILPSDGKPTEGQIQLEQALRKRVTTIKGQYVL